MIIIGCGGGGGGTGGSGGGSTGGIQGVIVTFYDGAGTLIASATTDANGNFSAQVPTDARYFALDPTSINSNSYYRSYTYNGLRYTPLDDGCRTPLPDLPDGGVFTLVTNIVVPTLAGPPPPPPTGCSAPPSGSGSGGTTTIQGRVVAG